MGSFSNGGFADYPCVQVRMIHERNTDAVNTNQNPAWGTIIGFAAMDTDTEMRVVILAVSLFFICFFIVLY